MLLLGAVVPNDHAPDVACAGLDYMTRTHVGWCRLVGGIGYEGQNLQIAMEVFWDVVGRGCRKGGCGEGGTIPYKQILKILLNQTKI